MSKLKFSGRFSLLSALLVISTSSHADDAMRDLRDDEVKAAWSQFNRDTFLVTALSHNSTAELQDCNSAYYFLSNLMAKEKPWMGYVYSNYASVFGQAAYAAALYKQEPDSLHKITTFRSVIDQEPFANDFKDVARGKIKECNILYRKAVEMVADSFKKEVVVK